MAVFLMRGPGFRATSSPTPKAKRRADEGTEFFWRDQCGRGILDGFDDHFDKSMGLAIDFPAMADFDNEYHEFLVLDVADDAIVADFLAL